MGNSFIFEFFLLGLENPESKTMYNETNQRIEKSSGNLYLAVVKGIPICVVFPKFIARLSIYFTTNVGTEAFVLPLPMWYVCYITEITTEISHKKN